MNRGIVIAIDYDGTSDERYTVELEVELTKLGWYKHEGSWAFFT